MKAGSSIGNGWCQRLQTAVVVAAIPFMTISGCNATVVQRQPATAPPPVPASVAAEATIPPGAENLNSVAWIQTAVEFRGTALQAYALARLRAEQALADPTWSAAIEQLEAGGYESLPPAVILDVDETVLDNSPYQARLIADETPYTSASWSAWVREAIARPIPGALEFTRWAHESGITVVYVTNRQGDLEEATRENLLREGFPVAEGVDAVMTRGERPDWASDKGTRREEVARTHRVLLLIGDNFGDFLSGILVSTAARDELFAKHRELWGREWIILPNPQYGSWDGALIDYEYGIGHDAWMTRKRAALRTERDGS